MKLLLIGIFLFSAVTSFSAVRTWNGGGADGNWTTAANWVGDAAPVTGDDLVFPASSAQFATNNDFSSTTFSFRLLTIDGGNYTIGGNNLRLTSGLNINGGNQFINTFLPITNSDQTYRIANGASATISSVFIANGFTFPYVLALDCSGSLVIGVLAGAGTLSKRGPGSTRIITTGGYSGTLSLIEGFLVNDANMPNSGVNITGGAIFGTTVLGGFGGSGTVGSVSVASGVISAGNVNTQPGILNINNSLGISSTGFYACKIGGTTAGLNGYDQLNVTGIVSLDDAHLLPIFIGGFNPATGDSFVIIRNDGTDAVSGTFLNAPEGSIITTPNNIAFRITYRGGDGNDIVLTRVRKSDFDFDTDGSSDISVFRPSNGAWYLERSQAGFFGMLFGFGDDKITPADFDGDGKTDIAVYRPSTGVWYIFNSGNGTFSYYFFGLAEDLPTPADYDGDGKADVSVFRPSTGTWYRTNSSDGSFYGVQFGLSEDKPTVGDFDGDGKADTAVFRPSTGSWYRINSSNGSISGMQFGLATDLIVPADYDGDGKTDIAVFRPSNNYWYIFNSSTSLFSYTLWGTTGDIPAPADFDGDGKADINVFRPSDGNWYRLNSSNGQFVATHFGQIGDKPMQAAFRY